MIPDATTLAESTWSSASAAKAGWRPPDRIDLTSRYVDLGHLGKGSQAFVRRALDTQLDRVVALKVLWPKHAKNAEACLRFFREARVTARLAHPGIVTIYDTGNLEAEPHLPFQVLSIVDWRTLRDLLHEVATDSTRARPAQLRSRVETMLRVAEAVAFAHARGIIHRDLKPANIAIGELGQVTVLDWGLAGGDGVLGVDGDGQPSGPSLTQHGTLRGTPLYMAPEQAFGDVATEASDVFAIGAMLYDLALAHPSLGPRWPLWFGKLRPASSVPWAPSTA